MPKPAVGGIPYSNASTKSKSMRWASSNPFRNKLSCSSNALRCKIGSFCSEYAFTISHPPAKVKIYKGSKTQEIVSPQYNWTWSFRRQAQAFVSHVLDDTLSLNPASDALEDLKLIEAMWQMELGVNSSNA